jgi:hypothetical protein
MSNWLDKVLVLIVVLASFGYVAYALGPKKLRNVYSRFATKHFGLRAARWFAGSTMKGSHDCHDCSARDVHMNKNVASTPTARSDKFKVRER